MTDVEIKIEKGVPIPPPRAPNLLARHLLSEMEIGDSIFIPGRGVSSASAGMNLFARRHAPNRKHVCRTVTENGVKGIRVWRIA